jgi:NADH dehydrogenase [ubiquinone] 1 alpha subcomplex assembly factor 1
MIRAFTCLTLLLLMNQSPTTLFHFNKDSDISAWNIVDDRVMGGISRGYFELTEDGYGKFYGYVTTESNGGFSSVDYDFDKLQVNPSDKIRIKLKGDGKTFQLRVKAFESDRHNYIKELDTTGEWQTIEIALSEMQPSWRGNKLSIPNFDKGQISSVTVLIGNGKKQNFELLIDAIELVKQ